MNETQSSPEKVVALRLTCVLVESTSAPPESGTRGAKQPPLLTGVWPWPITLAKPNTICRPFSLPQMTNAVRRAGSVVVLLPDSSQLKGPGTELESAKPVPPVSHAPPPPSVRSLAGQTANAAPCWPGATSVGADCTTT